MPSRVRAPRTTNVCFTINNPSETAEDHLASICDRESVTYLCFGRETGESGTYHLQGFLRTSLQHPHSWFRDIIGHGAHIEFAKGSAEQCIEYCEKDGDFVEHGRRPATNKSKGEITKEAWKNTINAAKRGALDEVEPEHYVKYYRTLCTIKKDHMAKPPDATGVTGVWYYGAAGAGKSRKARDDYPDAYLKMANKWWDGYQDDRFVILDDLDKKHDCLGHHLKIWADRYAFIAETKGGAVMIRPQWFIVTSQYSIDEIWEDEETREALHRRFKVTHILNYNGPPVQLRAQPWPSIFDADSDGGSQEDLSAEIQELGELLSSP